MLFFLSRNAGIPWMMNHQTTNWCFKAKCQTVHSARSFKLWIRLFFHPIFRLRVCNWSGRILDVDIFHRSVCEYHHVRAMFNWLKITNFIFAEFALEYATANLFSHQRPINYWWQQLKRWNQSKKISWLVHGENVSLISHQQIV